MGSTPNWPSKASAVRRRPREGSAPQPRSVQAETSASPLVIMGADPTTNSASLELVARRARSGHAKHRVGLESLLLVLDLQDVGRRRRIVIPLQLGPERP